MTKFVFGIENEDGSLHSLYFRLHEAQKALHELGGVDLGYALWTALTGELLNRRYIDQPDEDRYETIARTYADDE